MEIQQHDGVVVEAAVISAGLRQAQREGEVVRGEGGARDLGSAAVPPPLYIGPLGGAGPRRSRIQGGGGGQGVELAPQVRWGSPHL